MKKRWAGLFGIMVLFVFLPQSVLAGLTITPGTSQTNNDRQYIEVCETGSTSILHDGSSQVAGLIISPGKPGCRQVDVTGMSPGEINTFFGRYASIAELEAAVGDSTGPGAGGTPPQGSTGNTGNGGATGPRSLVPNACDDPELCGTCEFVSTVNNVIQFIIELCTLLAVGVFMYAGFLMVTSQGNPGTLSKAKGLFTNVVIGLVLVLAAFLIVNTVLAGFLKSGSSALRWQTIQCTYPTVARPPLATNFNNSTEWENEPQYIQIGDSFIQINQNQFAANSGVCGREFLSKYFSAADAADASCIVEGESACGAKLMSRSDLAGGIPFSIGAFQINTTVHQVTCGGRTLDCPSAWSGKDYGAVLVNRNLYEQCKNALLNPDCSALNAARIKDRRGSWNDWSTAAGCGLRR